MMWNGLCSDQEYGPNKVRPICRTHVVLTVKDGVNKKLLEKIKYVIVMHSVANFVSSGPKYKVHVEHIWW